VYSRIKYHILLGFGNILLNTEYRFVVFQNRVLTRILIPKT